jgi:hypothetical protein
LAIIKKIRTLTIENIKFNRLIEDTEDFEFIINNDIRLYVNLDYEFKLTILDKLKCPFTIFFEDEIQITNNSISSSVDFEIIIESSFKPTNGYIKIFSMDYNEFK